METKNARIVSVSLTRADHGCFSIWLTLDYGGSGQGFGGFALDGPYNNTLKRREANKALGYFVMRVLDVVDVDSWEKVAGNNIRVRASLDKVEAIGNFLEDRWFCPREELEGLSSGRIPG